MGPDVAAREELRIGPGLLSQLLVFATFYATVNPRLFSHRHWLLPAAFASIWHVSTRFYISDPFLNALNFTNCLNGVTTTMKLLNIMMLNEPPKYNKQLACSKQSMLCKNCLVNAFSYMADYRCLHWQNDNPCHIPKDTRPDGSYLQFYTSTFLLFLEHIFYFDAAQALISNIGTHALPQGDTIFRDTYALTRNYTIHLPHSMFSAVPMTFLAGLAIRSSLIAGHSLVTLLAAPLACLSVSPYSLPPSALKKEWPPLFDSPVQSASVRDFWSRRWHAVFRRDFWAVGLKPGVALGRYIGGLVDSTDSNKKVAATRSENSARVIGMRIGGTMGVFLASGLMHDFGMWGMGQGTDFRRVTGFFLIQGVAIVLEEALGLTKKRKDKNIGNGFIPDGNGVALHEGEKVEPTSGAHHYFMRLWTFVWIIFPATRLIDAWLQRGVTCVTVVPHWLSPARALIRVWNHFAYGM